MPKLKSKTNEAFLSVSDVIDRARAEFGFVHVDGRRGMQFVAQRWLLSQKTPVQQDSADTELGPLADSVEMIVGDDRRSDRDFLKCFVIPGEPIVVEYVFDGHDACCRPLMRRLAAVLHYELLNE